MDGMNDDINFMPKGIRYYKLDGKKVKISTLSEVFSDDGIGELKNRRVGFTTIHDVDISTVFLVIDHGYDRVPLLFETMVFGGDMDGYCWRYPTYQDAEAGHEEVVEMVRQHMMINSEKRNEDTEKEL